MKRCEVGTFVHTGVCFLFVLSSIFWFFLWLPEEVLTWLFLLHRENGDFSILMKDIHARLLLQRSSLLYINMLCVIDMVNFGLFGAIWKKFLS
jgi:hypothetical protein